MLPSVEKGTLVSLGTEATMSAIRLARGFTGRDKIIKFEGCYHGHADSLLVKGRFRPVFDFRQPELCRCAGAGGSRYRCLLQYNNPQQLAKPLPASVRTAAIIVEPVAGNMNLIKPTDEFLQAMRNLCDQHIAADFDDEVMTGFVLAWVVLKVLFGIRRI